MFLKTNYRHLLSHSSSSFLLMDPEKQQAFSNEVYTRYDISLNLFTMELFYRSGSDVSLFFPSEILAALAILLHEVRLVRDEDPILRQLKNDFLLQSFLDTRDALTLDSPIFETLQKVSVNMKWMSRVTE